MTFYKVDWFACVVGVFKLRIQERPYFHLRIPNMLQLLGGAPIMGQLFSFSLHLTQFLYTVLASSYYTNKMTFTEIN